MKKFIKYFFIFIVTMTVLGAILSLFSNSEETSTVEAVDDSTVKEKIKTTSCDYSQVTITAYQLKTDKVIDQKVVKSCFNTKKDPIGLIEVSSKESPIMVLYYDESPMTTLSVKLNNEDATRWRKNKGHDIYKIEKDGKLTFIFSDKKTMKATVVFEK